MFLEAFSKKELMFLLSDATKSFMCCFRLIDTFIQTSQHLQNEIITLIWCHVGLITLTIYSQSFPNKINRLIYFLILSLVEA
mmetsp:Transcript_26241/g.39329  ORF Transcript_26241/g.39329 Transcript_26241/m.39329 type:complete len:82 (+) Transcript_26241:120-365(+)